MTQVLSLNTQAILLLTAPLFTGRGTKSPDLLSPGEYKRLARHLREIQHQPADLVSSEAAEVLRACQPVIDESRLQRLLGRGFLLSQVIERWQTRAIWVVSRADAEYPRRLKARLREDAPAVLYGCGDMGLLETGGLAVVGSRHVDDPLIEYTMAVGRLAARAGRTLVSGGAKGIDQAAMRGALEAGGKVCGVLADNLEKTAMNREHRNFLLDGQLVLMSAYDPRAGFNVGNAMQRNKLIYALAEAALVISSDLNKGGTWSGAKEQLDKFQFVPVYIRSSGEKSEGLDALQKKGALPWPNPQDANSFAEVFNSQILTAVAPQQVGLSMFDESVTTEATTLIPAVSNPHAPIEKLSDSHLTAESSEDLPKLISDSKELTNDWEEPTNQEPSPSEVLFSTVKVAIQQILKEPMKDAEVAAALDVTNAQGKAWLQRLEKDGVVEKLSRPVRYTLRKPDLFS
jgi:DNA processing protein